MEAERATAAVLAGGASSRMGRDKAFVDFRGRPLVTRVAERVGAVCDEVIVVAKAPRRLEALGLRVVVDETDRTTPLAGIATALGAASRDRVLVVACDMPHVSTALCRRLLELLGDHDACVPVRDGRLEPLHAVWNARSAEVVREELAAGEDAPHRLLGRLDVRTVPEAQWREIDPKGRSFANLNTPRDLDREGGDRATR